MQKKIINNKYRLVKRIARGGMADIFLADVLGYSNFSRKVIVKKIASQFKNDREFFEMFIDEAKIMSLLYHPNIVQVIDFDIYNGEPFIVMEYIKGANLSKVQKRLNEQKKVIPLQVALFITYKILEALDYSHNLFVNEELFPIIHRDISPQNILLSVHGDIKLIDFGVAKAESKLNHTSPGALKGKFSYIAPEQKESSNVDERADLYSVSIVLFEMLLGLTTEERVTNYPNQQELEKKVESLNLDIDLKRLLLFGLQENPRHRIQSAEQYRRQILNHLSISKAQKLLQDIIKYYVIPYEIQTAVKNKSSTKQQKESNYSRNIYNNKVRNKGKYKKKNYTLVSLTSFNENFFPQNEGESFIDNNYQNAENNYQNISSNNHQNIGKDHYNNNYFYYYSNPNTNQNKVENNDLLGNKTIVDLKPFVDCSIEHNSNHNISNSINNISNNNNFQNSTNYSSSNFPLSYNNGDNNYNSNHIDEDTEKDWDSYLKSIKSISENPEGIVIDRKIDEDETLEVNDMAFFEAILPLVQNLRDKRIVNVSFEDFRRVFFIFLYKYGDINSIPKEVVETESMRLFLNKEERDSLYKKAIKERNREIDLEVEKTVFQSTKYLLELFKIFGIEPVIRFKNKIGDSDSKNNEDNEKKNDKRSDGEKIDNNILESKNSK